MSSKTQNRLLILALVCLDTSMLLAGWWLAFYARITSEILPYQAYADPQEYARVVLASLPLWWACFSISHLYDPDELLGGPQEYAHIVKACGFGFVAMIGMSVFFKSSDLSRGWLVIGLILTTALVGFARFVFRRVIYALRRSGLYIRRTLIVGASEAGRAIARQLMPAEASGILVLGFVDDFLPIGTIVMKPLCVIGATTSLASIVREQHAEQVILIPGSMAWESFQGMLRNIALTMDNYAVKLSPGFYEVLTTGVKVSYSNHIPLLDVERTRIIGIDALLKNSLDYGLGMLLFLLSLPLMLVIGCVIRMTSRGPVLDAVPVLGRNGKPFDCFKFHTSDSSLAYSQTGRVDGRGGANLFLFQTGLDKLPQLFNVLRGQLSLVGPRPVNVPEVGDYSRWLPNLVTLKPGMTGSRVAAKQLELTLEEEMRLDLYYARNYSIWLDLLIVFQTISRILHRERILRKIAPQSPNLAQVGEHRTVSPAISPTANGN